MSGSAETPSSSLNISQPDKSMPPSPPEATPLPPTGNLNSSLASPQPPSKSDNSPPPPETTSPPPPTSSSPPPGSPPPSSPPPPSASSPPPHSPPPAQKQDEKSLPEASPPPPKSASPPPPSLSSSPPPSPADNASPPPTSGKSSPPPSPPPASPPPSIGFVPPPTDAGTINSPPPPKTFRAPPPAIPLPSPNKVPSTASPPGQSASGGSSSSGGSSKASTRATRKSPQNGSGNDVSDDTKAVIGAVVAAMVLIVVIAIFLVVKKRKKRQDFYTSQYMPPPNFTIKTDGYYYAQPGYSGPANFSYSSQHSHSPDSYGSQHFDSGVLSGNKAHFSYEEVMEMTDGFCRQNIIGEGGFGCVFKGRVLDGRTVAVKQLKAGSGQGDREFKAEVEIISRVHHRHLVSLVGYCISDRQRLLLYEFVPNKTLEHHLHAKGMPVLDWPKRLKIAIGSAKGLAYLHEDCNPKIIHRDIKSANILLDDNFEAQVADFGLARLNDSTQTHVSTRVMGTFGYLAPEYASSGKLTDRSDVYSFGVVLLELITGRKPVDPSQPLGDESLVEWARPQLLHAIETGDISELVDARLKKHYVESEMFRMIETAAACVRHSAPKRPRMVQVVRALDSEELSDLTNGVKYGQSTAYDSGQYNQDIMKFRKMAFSSTTSSEFDAASGDYTSREVSDGPTPSSLTSREFGSQAKRISEEKRFGGPEGTLGSRRNI